MKARIWLIVAIKVVAIAAALLVPFSKLLETFDGEVHELTHVVSGHTLKRIAAATAGVAVCRMLLLRTPTADASQSVPQASATVAVRNPTLGPG